MATLNAAVQQMIDRLNAALAAGTASAEDQLLIGKALQALQSSTTWERALIAVAEQHLNTGTTALASARALLDAAKVTLDNSSAALNTQAANLELVPTIRRELAMLPSHFIVGHNRCDARIEGIIDSSDYQVDWCLSLDDYETSTFVCYLSRYNGSSFNRQFVSINSNGQITVSTFTPVLGSVSAIFPAPNQKQMLWTLSGTTVSVYLGAAATPSFTFSMQDQIVFFDRATRKSYVRSSNTLMEVTDTAATVVSPTVPLATAADFRTYASARGWVEHSNGLLFSTADSGSTINAAASASSSGDPMLFFGRDMPGNTNKFAYSYYLPPTAGNSFAARELASGTSSSCIGSIVYDGTSLGGGSSVHAAFVSASFNVRFMPTPTTWKQITVEVVPDIVMISGQLHPYLKTVQVVAFSHIHNAILVRGCYSTARQSSGSATLRTFTALSFGR